MNHIPSLLMVTWNRREYFEKTIAHLLSDPSAFEIYFWDNGSADGVADLILDLRDDRIKEKQFSPTNVGQFDAWHWFMQRCRGQTAGKLDDDIRGELGWMTRFSQLATGCKEIGALGAWVYLPSEWDEEAARHKIVQVGENRIFQNTWVPGGVFIARLDVLRKYTIYDRSRLGVPFDQVAMTRAGLINGYPLPISFAEHLDDPRSPHCRMNRPGGWDQFASYTARMRNFSGPEEYGRWIAADARNVLETNLTDQISTFSPGILQRISRKVAGKLATLSKKTFSD